MSTYVSVNVYTHTVTYVTDKMMSSLAVIIRRSGLDPEKLHDDWHVIERGLKKWIETQDLERLILEVFNPRTDVLVGRWDFDIYYGFGSEDDGSMWLDPDAVKYAIKKYGLNPSGCDYHIVATTKPGRPDVPGWSKTTLRSTDGFTRQSVGTIIGAAPLGTGVAYWRKTG